MLRVKEAAVKYTYADYAAIDDGKRYEIIDGVIYLMSPAPFEAHQRILGKLFLRFGNYLEGKPCRVFVAPFDVCLNAEGDKDNTVVQPDIFIVCDKSKLDGKRCNGAPDMAIEILSPSSISRDMMIKLSKYLEAGVREYWVVDPENKKIYVNILNNGKYDYSEYKSEDVISVNILDGFGFSLESIFAEE